MRNILLTIVGVFALIATFTGCERVQKVVPPEKGVAPEAMDTLKIGFLASGSRVTYPNGGKIAVAEINATAALLGVPVELVTEVGDSDP